MTRRWTLYLPALLAVAAGLMASCAAVLAVSGEAEATFPGQNGKIAYSGYDSEIYTIDPRGGASKKPPTRRRFGPPTPTASTLTTWAPATGER